MTMDIALALLSFSAPVTAAILGGVVWVWKRKVASEEKPSDGPYLTTREFDNFRHDLNRKLDAISRKLDEYFT